LFFGIEIAEEEEARFENPVFQILADQPLGELLGGTLVALKWSFYISKRSRPHPARGWGT
jgi:hypothetical protein